MREKSSTGGSILVCRFRLPICSFLGLSLSLRMLGIVLLKVWCEPSYRCNKLYIYVAVIFLSPVYAPCPIQSSLSDCFFEVATKCKCHMLTNK